MEVYRVASSLVSSSTCVSLDVGHMFGTTGMVDFYVNNTSQWIIEIRRNNSELKEHCNRFDDGGLYALIPRKGVAILNFLDARKNPLRFELLPDVWYIHCSPDFDRAEVFRQNQATKAVVFACE